MLQGTIGNQATLRYLTHRLSNLPAKWLAERHEQEVTPENMTAREAPRGPSWDFSKIPVFPPDRAYQPHPSSPLAATPLPGAIQAKLAVGQINDPLEHEADRVADQVMRMSNPTPSIATAPPQINRKCTACEEEETSTLQTKSTATAKPVGGAPPVVHEVLRSPGQPLDGSTRAYFEPRFAQDFGKVRVHTGAAAEQSARKLYAHAYTVGNHITFGTGRFNPGTYSGRRLIAHELAHVVQQSGGGPRIQRSPDKRWVRDEHAARLRGNIMANRIRNHGILSPEARAKINAELQYFEGPAKDEYLRIVRPVLGAFVEIEMPEMNMVEKPVAQTPPVVPTQPSKPQACTRLPDTSSGKKCKFFVYDSTLPGALGTLWKVAAFGDAAPRPATYVIQSGENMEELLENILETYAEKDCDCTDEVQFWSHGSSGNGAWISGSQGGKSQMVAGDFNIPGIETYGDDRTLPGYQEWEAKLTPYQRRMLLLRRTICDSNSTIYYRSCQAFQGKEGQEFAKASSDFWRCDVSGHTKSIGLSQPGKHTLSPCQEPDWPAAEGADEESKKDKDKLREVKPK
jgi:hypothetical protein